MILAGGFSKRFGRDKGLVKLAGKALVIHVLDRVCEVADEIIIVVGSDAQLEAFSRLLGGKASLVVDAYKGQAPLVGALTGFENVNAEYSLLLPCDAPFVSRDITALLLDLCIDEAAVIPRWPNGYIEPLHAAYHTKSAITAAKVALDEKKLTMASMIAHLHRTRYVSTLVLQQLDAKLLTFFNVNTPEDFKRAESIAASMFL